MFDTLYNMTSKNIGVLVTYLLGNVIWDVKTVFSSWLAWNKPTVGCRLREICLYAAVATQSVKALIRLYKSAWSVCETGRMKVFTVFVCVYRL